MAKTKVKSRAPAPVSPDEAGLVAFVQANPDDTTARAALADWLDEHDRPLDAAKQRDAAGISEVYYKLRRKSDGLFSEGREQSRGTGIDIVYRWSTKGKSWRRLEDLRAHLAALRPWSRTYGGRGKAGTSWTDLEVVVVEVRAVTLAHLPITFGKPGQDRGAKSVVVGAPAG